MAQGYKLNLCATVQKNSPKNEIKVEREYQLLDLSITTPKTNWLIQLTFGKVIIH